MSKLVLVDLQNDDLSPNPPIDETLDTVSSQKRRSEAAKIPVPPEKTRHGNLLIPTLIPCTFINFASWQTGPRESKIKGTGMHNQGCVGFLCVAAVFISPSHILVK